MKIYKAYKFVRAMALVFFMGVLFTSYPAYAGHDNGKGNGGMNNGHGNGKGGDDGDDGDDNGDDGGGAVPVNGGIAILAVVGVAYAAKKIYELKPAAATN